MNELSFNILSKAARIKIAACSMWIAAELRLYLVYKGDKNGSTLRKGYRVQKSVWSVFDGFASRAGIC